MPDNSESGEPVLTPQECRRYATEGVREFKDLVKTRMGADAAFAMTFAAAAVATASEIKRERGDGGPREVLQEWLWDLGWAIYEQAWAYAEAVRPQVHEARTDVITAAVKTLAECAQGLLPMKHYAPRAVGAMRAYALILSKRDTTEDYTHARSEHWEAAQWITAARYEAEELKDDRLVAACREVEVQLDTSLAGTNCRSVESILCAPSRRADLSDQPPDASLREVAESARRAMEAGVRALTNYALLPLPKQGDTRRERLMRADWPRQPANMAARAHLLIVPCLMELEALNWPYGKHSLDDIWQRYVDYFSKGWNPIDLGPRPASVESEVRFHRTMVSHFVAIAEKAVLDYYAPGTIIERKEVAETARIRLHYHLQYPESGPIPVHDVRLPYASASLADGGVEVIKRLSLWLPTVDDGHDANVIGSATYRPWVDGLARARARSGGGSFQEEFDRYLDWRRHNPRLDRYWLAAGQSDFPVMTRNERRPQVEGLLGEIDW